LSLVCVVGVANTLLTPYEQYFIQTLHQEGRQIPEQFAGEKKTPSYSTHSATLLLVSLPTTTTGTYLSNTFNFT